MKKCVARVVDGVVDLLLRGKRYLRDLKFFTRSQRRRLDWSDINDYAESCQVIILECESVSRDKCSSLQKESM